LVVRVGAGRSQRRKEVGELGNRAEDVTKI
jgi:hypothetical protein